MPCARHCAKHITFIISSNPHNNFMNLFISFSIIIFPGLQIRKVNLRQIK